MAIALAHPKSQSLFVAKIDSWRWRVSIACLRRNPTDNWLAVIAIDPAVVPASQLHSGRKQRVPAESIHYRSFQYMPLGAATESQPHVKTHRICCPVIQKHVSFEGCESQGIKVHAQSPATGVIDTHRCLIGRREWGAG